MIALLTSLRPPAESGADPMVRAVADAGCDAVSIGTDCLLGDVARVASAALSTGLGVGPLWAPVAERAPGPGRRLPYFTATHRDERAAAVAAVGAVMDVGADLGARLVVLQAGRVPLSTSERELRLAIRRGELDEDVGQELRGAALGERRAISAGILDACRWSLERLLRRAERSGTLLALELAGSPWLAPSPMEAEQVLQDFTGAGLGVLWAPGALDALQALAVRVPDDRRRALADAALAALATEAVGVEPDYLPGLGETDLRAGLSMVRPATTVILGGRPDSSPRELRRAVELVRACLPAEPPVRSGPSSAAR